MSEEIILTAHGKTELENELKDLQNHLIEVVDEVNKAREQGDLRENAEFASAREEQGKVTDRIAEIELLLKNAKIAKSVKKDTVTVGTRVILAPSAEYEIVSTVEADPVNNKLGSESPLGKLLIGKKIGDEIKAPNGKVLTIKEIL